MFNGIGIHIIHVMICIVVSIYIYSYVRYRLQYIIINRDYNWILVSECNFKYCENTVHAILYKLTN